MASISSYAKLFCKFVLYLSRLPSQWTCFLKPNDLCFVQINRLKAHKSKLLKWEFLWGSRIFCSGSMLELIFFLMIEINVCIVTKYGTFKCISSCGKRLKSENDVQVCSLFFFPWIYSSSISKTKVLTALVGAQTSHWGENTKQIFFLLNIQQYMWRKYNCFCTDQTLKLFLVSFYLEERLNIDCWSLISDSTE